VQWHFRVIGELILKQPSQQKPPFLLALHFCTVINFCQNALKTYESQFIILPGHPHRVVVALLTICWWGVSCHAQMGQKWQSYNPGDKICIFCIQKINLSELYFTYYYTDHTLNFPALPGTVIQRIHARGDIMARFLWGKIIWSLNYQESTKYRMRSEYQSYFS